MTTTRSFTDDLASALATAGVAVSLIERRTGPSDADIIRLDGDQYLGVCYEDFERVGAIGVYWDTEMPAGGNPTHADWSVPDSTAASIASELAAAMQE